MNTIKDTIFKNPLWLAALSLGALLSLAPKPAAAQGRSDMSWSADVDDTVIVSVRNFDVRTDTVFGKSTDNVSTQVFNRLPRGPVYAYLAYRRGRGQVRIVQQPTPDNDFTAKVRIHDPQPGRSHYEFALGWSSRPRRDFDGDRDGYFMAPSVRAFRSYQGY